MEPLFELAIELPPPSSHRLLRSLHQQLRAAILERRLKPASRMPASRALARHLAVSRNTVLAGYGLLVREGLLVARRGAGTFVAEVRSHARRPHATPPRLADRIAPTFRPLPYVSLARTAKAIRYNFHTGVPETRAFPFDCWRRLAARAGRAFEREHPVWEEPQGRAGLRDAIAHHVSTTRGVACTADDVIVTSGTRQALDLIARVFTVPGATTVAVEDPVFGPVKRVFQLAGSRVRAVPVDAEGLVVERIPSNTAVVCVSPSHQYPLGVRMSAERRAALLDFAAASSAIIVEDDYDSEFRLVGHPIDALQTLDRHGCVIYVGTFSKCVFPALRLGFMVAPPWARESLVAAKQETDGPCSVVAQDTLASFIAEGHLAKHVRKMRRIYHDRHSALVAALNEHCASTIDRIPIVAGVHVSGYLRAEYDAHSLAEAALERGILVDTLDRYAVGKTKLNGLAFGYGLIEADEIAVAVRKLAGVMKDLTR